MTKVKDEKIIKLISAIGETILGIPLLGGLLVICSLWSALLIMMIVHIMAIVFELRTKKKEHKIAGNVWGIITSTLAWIPFVGMILHMITAIILWIEYAQE
jgi:hypothetical protein